MTLKAFIVFPGEYPNDEWCVLSFAKTRGQARMLGQSVDGNDFIEMTAWRKPDFDKYAEGDTPYNLETNDELPKGADEFYNEIEL